MFDPDLTHLRSLLAELAPQGRPALLPALHAAQRLYGWLPEPVAAEVGRALGVPLADVHGVIDFYAMFSRQPMGRSVVRVCSAPICALAGGDAVADALCRYLKVEPEDVIAEVNASGLIGRGGAAFPTGVKWEGAAKAPGQPKYIVCNADESEPGTFKDRILMEEDPHRTIEGMIIAAYAVGARQGYIYVRGEFPYAFKVMGEAVEEARQAGTIGKNILGSGLDFDIEMRLGAGAYICGEETALLESIEGKRGFPRIKPPFPTTNGLFD